MLQGYQRWKSKHLLETLLTTIMLFHLVTKRAISLGYVRVDGLSITGVSFDKGTREANAGIAELVLEFILFPVLWWENGAGAGWGVPLVDRVLDR
jgi:hypothetical protein